MKSEVMGDMQKTAYEDVMAVAARLRDGEYGWGDDLDVGSLEHDLENVTWAM